MRVTGPVSTFPTLPVVSPTDFLKFRYLTWTQVWPSR